MEEKDAIKLVHTVNQWKAGRIVLAEFLRLHPELHIRYTENVYNNFVRLHGRRLAESDVMRKTGHKSPAMFDVTKFDRAAFDIFTRKHLSNQSRQQGIPPSEQTTDGGRA